MRRRAALVTFTTALTLAACSAPPPDKPAAGEKAVSPAAESQAAQTPPLIPGMGNHHHPIATTSPEAQRYFDQGFDLVFGFNHEEAVRSFTRAAELDPKAAMPHWGIAWALGPNYNVDVDDERSKQAYAAMADAVTLSKDGPANERAYIEAMAIRFSPDPKADRAALARKYADKMREITHRFPDDLDAATLYAESLMNLNAWKLWALDGKPAPGTEEIVAVLESVLARDPNHLGANHYYIHTVEASPNPARALASAARLDSMAPAAGHLSHMPAHIYARTGDQAGAARANMAGIKADREYLKTAPADGFYGLAYYTHNLHFLADSEMMQGNLAQARQAAAEVAERLAPHTQMMPMVESMITMKTAVLLRFGRHDEILALAQPPADHPVEVAWWHFARGVALARTGKLDGATAERAALVDASAKVPNDALFGGTGLASAKDILGLATLVLDARLAQARGSQADAIRLWTSAVAAADKVPYDEPPVFYYPVRESLGAALLLGGKAEDAERAFREDLVRHPRNARSLFGLHESLVNQGKAEDAEWVKRAFDEAWKNADTTLTLELL
jgi:tetratricopeptide (TPR) repeat protein